MASAGYGAPSADPAATLFEDHSHVSTHESAHFDTIASEVIDANLPVVNPSLWPTIYDGFFLNPQDHFINNAHDHFDDGVDLVDSWPGTDLSLVPSTESTTTSVTVTTEKTRVKRKRRITNGYGCDSCDETYHTAGDLAKHKLRKHTPSAQWPFVCNLCDKRFYDKRDYGRHVDVENRRAAVMQAGAQMPAVASSVTTFALEPPFIHTRTASEATDTTSVPQVNHQSLVLGGYHARHNHDSSAGARAGAHVDLERLSTLPVVEITVSAKVVMGREIVSFSASHEIESAPVDLAPATGLLIRSSAPSSEPTFVASAIPPQTRMHWAIGLMGAEADDVVSERPEIVTPPSIAISMTRSKSVVVKPLTLEIRTRPSMRRSFTCPSNVTKLCSDFTTSCGLGEQSIMKGACTMVC